MMEQLKDIATLNLYKEVMYCQLETKQFYYNSTLGYFNKQS